MHSITLKQSWAKRINTLPLNKKGIYISAKQCRIYKVWLSALEVRASHSQWEWFHFHKGLLYKPIPVDTLISPLTILSPSKHQCEGLFRVVLWHPLPLLMQSMKSFPTLSRFWPWMTTWEGFLTDTPRDPHLMEVIKHQPPPLSSPTFDGFSETLGWILLGVNVYFSNPTCKTLQKLLVRVKDTTPLLLTLIVVYSIPCRSCTGGFT